MSTERPQQKYAVIITPGHMTTILDLWDLDEWNAESVRHVGAHRPIVTRVYPAGDRSFAEMLADTYTYAPEGSL